MPPLPGSALPTFPSSALPTDGRLGTASSGSTSTSTSASDGMHPNPAAVLSPAAADFAAGRALSLSLSGLAEMHAYGYSAITPPDSGDSSAAAAVPDMGISPQRTLGTAVRTFGY
ncbi:hypothetical protein CALCODRAFT_499873 [Calocera cornea HHB12733]|uniref:Uncharacterized protein n=1 Tax=Calocera cornea HHB12733 TaxID=1353952 RepID=A0A165EAB4_9BASI|nr:hypothetical protein CALCODRAFT_499873 [Calocera cornea HHB12733]